MAGFVSSSYQGPEKGQRFPTFRGGVQAIENDIKAQVIAEDGSWLDGAALSLRNFFAVNAAENAERKYERLSFIEKLVRLSIFKTADLNRSLFEWHLPLSLPFVGKHLTFLPISWLYDVVYPPINFFMAGECRKEGYDAARANKARCVFERLGAESTILKTADNVEIESMLIRSGTLKKKIEAFGGEWKKMEVAGSGTCLVIVPPAAGQEKIAEWKTFEERTLSQMKKFWPETKINGRICLITSKNGERIADIDAEEKKTKLMFFLKWLCR